MVADVAPAHSTSAPSPLASSSSLPIEALDSGLLYPHSHPISIAATMLHNAQHNHSLVTNGSSVSSTSPSSGLNGSPASSLAVPPSFAALSQAINQQQNMQNAQQNNIQPADANLKLFLGQIPRHVTENDLRKLFEKYGTIADLSVLRDRHTQAHRGCAFLTYTKPESAAMAIEQVHEKISLHNRPIVVRYAGAMNAPQECKLFVGMLSRTTDESRIIQLFAKYGIVKEVYLMRELNGGMSKGCAFVKLSSRDEGQYAINELNDIFQDEGAPRKLVVRFADSKANRTRTVNDVMGQQPQSVSMQQQLQQLSPSHQTNAAASVNFSSPTNQQLIAANLAAAAAAAASGQLLTVSSLPSQHWQNNPSWNINPYARTYNPHTRTNSTTSPTQVNSNSPVAAAYASYAAAYPNYTQSNEFTNNSFQNTFGVLTNNNALNSNSLSSMSSAAAAAVAALQQATQGMAGLSVSNSSNLSSSNSNMNGLNSISSPAAARGPPGSNLFIYNLPESFTDVDLQQLFQPYGSVLSVRVFRDKNTGLSRGFGFVSYDSLMSAEKAISAMNGAAVGGKRIKVMHKDAEKKVMELAAAAAAAAQQIQDVAQLQQLQHSFAF